MTRNNELLLNNALTEDFQRMLRPYYLAQRVLCASKYSIKDNFVLPNSRAYCVVALFLLCFITYAYYDISFTRAHLRISNENDACGVCNEILKVFSLSSNLMQYQVLSYIVSTFTDNLMTVQVVIEWTKNLKILEAYKNVSYLYVLKFIRNIKNISFVVIFSVACERFYCRVDDIKNDCAAALDSRPERGSFRKTIKNILRLCNDRFSKMRACGLLTVDAALPLRLVGLVATYCIVLLQFAFL